MKKILELLVGENQDKRIIFLIFLPALSLSAFIFMAYPMTLATTLTAFLGFDILAGLLSNLQPKTNLAWKKQPSTLRTWFVVIHLTLYPLFVILFQVSIPLMIMMLVMLLSKTMAFVFGSF
jgi:hypothetical protein